MFPIRKILHPTDYSELNPSGLAEGVMRKAPCPVVTVKAPQAVEVPAPPAPELVFN